MQDWIATVQDRELFDRELDSFIPPRIFDAHAHLYLANHFPPGEVPGLVSSGPAVVGFEEFDRRIAEITPGRSTEGLFFPFPQKNVNVAAENEFLFQKLTNRPYSRGQMLMTPTMAPDSIRETVKRCGHVDGTH